MYPANSIAFDLEALLQKGTRVLPAMILGASVLVAVLETPLVRRLALWFKVVDEPGPRKIHAQAIPRLGGVAIFFGTLAGLLLLTLFGRNLEPNLEQVSTKHTVFFAAGFFIFVLGVIDDIKHLRAGYKFVAETAAAILVTAYGVRIQTLSVPGLFPGGIDFGILSWPLTVLWIVGITNAVNIIDGLDGLAAGIAAIACATIGLFAFAQGHYMLASVAFALFGSVVGFLIFNFNPAKIFMGDSGSLFLGFMLGGGSVLFTGKFATLVGLALPVLALGIPIFDTLLCMLRRFLERRSIFAPDRSHIHHRLLEMGLTHKKVVLTLYGVTLLVTGIGAWFMAVQRTRVVVAFLGALLVLLLFFRLIGQVRIRQSLARIKEKVNQSRRKSKIQRMVEELELELRAAIDLEEWWKALSKAGDQLGFSRLVLPMDKRSGGKQVLVWSRNGTAAGDLQPFSFRIPVPHRRSGKKLLLKAEVDDPESLEEVTFKATWLARLIDGKSIADLPRKPRSRILSG